MTVQLKSLNDITPQSRHIFLSPHFDDVVYSCGGTLGIQVSVGLRPLVITIFGGAPAANAEISSFANTTQSKWGLGRLPANIIEARRQEDAAALDLLGVDYLWLDYPEAIYRGEPAFYTNDQQLMGGEV